MGQLNSQLQWRGRGETGTKKAEVEEENMLEEGRGTSELRVCVLACMYMYAYVYACTHMYAMRVCACVHIYVHVCVGVHTHVSHGLTGQA